MRAIGIDVGGTFTDLVDCGLDGGAAEIHKVSRTPAAPSKGMLTGIAELCATVGVTRAEIGAVFHGTAIATTRVRRGG
ncbi:hydantoinase/oxoprolinase N-terminal domain-containing protein [Acuticoccus mangrovi]|uniref:Hydantoinase/oxoprolinase N-terminal domain-containing protein n=1 Tax=Acuticoccus mangrovi TaxID=2796142 RepID=A0A934IQR6_9HYPH|nr:hydantoinase/oxoprolinase N-terminal domain-containing protein [Acuticoccus mangrovi]MBJ3778367.1 hypothetical protein [Acuticoccus mangrovi]